MQERNLGPSQCNNCGRERLFDSDFCKICDSINQMCIDLERRYYNSANEYLRIIKEEN